MPLRDHFHPPLTHLSTWDALHGAWPTLIVMDLNQRLPARYIASPHIHLGASFEVDVAATEYFGPLQSIGNEHRSDISGSVATAAWAPPQPTAVMETDLPEQDEYEIRIVEQDTRRLVAVIEIVSPANKDRPEHRRAFAAKCATMLQQRVSVSVIDLVTLRRGNLHAELMDLLGSAGSNVPSVAPDLYAVTYRAHEYQQAWRLETWMYSLEIGSSLPIIPLWLSPELGIPLELEKSYEASCSALRIR